MKSKELFIWPKNKQTNRQMNKQTKTNKQADKQTNEQADKQTNEQADKQTNWPIIKKTNKNQNDLSLQLHYGQGLLSNFHRILTQ